jgi:hypothetical protein
VTTAGTELPAQVAPNGAWTFDAQLESGENVLLITATNAGDNITQTSLRLFYDRPIPTPSTPAPTAISDTDAASTFWHIDVANGATPSTRIIGTTVPGALVSATSLYGSATTASDTDGAWTISLSFINAPIGEEFLVTVSVAPPSGPVATQQFPFTYLGTN